MCLFSLWTIVMCCQAVSAAEPSGKKYLIIHADDALHPESALIPHAQMQNDIAFRTRIEQQLAVVLSG